MTPSSPFRSWSLLAIAAAAAVLIGLPSDAFAQGILSAGIQRINTVQQYAVSATFSLGTIGLVVLGVFAFFGRFKWTHFFSLAGGMFLVTMATQLFSFIATSAP